MISLPFLLAQPTPSGCLPTAVRAALLWALCAEAPDDCTPNLVSHNEIADLCHENETVFGCDWDVATAELGSVYNVEDLTGDIENIRAALLDGHEPQPVIVIVGDRSGSTTGTHAIVLLDIRVDLSSGETEESIVFYDPSDGALRELHEGAFWSAWSLGGEYAMIIRL